MNPRIAANQQRLFLEFLSELRPYLRRDSALPRRIKEILARHRAIGSRDRKLYRELIYTAIRFLPWVEPFLDSTSDGRAAARRPAMPGSLTGPAASTGPTEISTAAKITAWLAPDLKPTAHYRAAVCGDWPPVPDTLVEKAAILGAQLSAFCARPAEGGARSPDALSSASSPRSSLPAPRFSPADLLPAWFLSHCPAAFHSPHLDMLNRRANVWVRLQCTDRNLVLDEFRARGWSFTVDPDFPDAVCLPPNAEIAGTDSFRRGFIEIQDLGSQMVLAHAAPPPGGRWLDACAGAGGKTLQLARLLGAGGHVDATDIRPEILDELRDRSTRARVSNISIVEEPAAHYDGVLVDAPCSGSGTWRRQPHLKWSVQPAAIAAFSDTQLRILTAHAPRVRPGGLLVYATCSLSHQENHDVVAAFLKTHPHFSSEAPARNYGGQFDGLGTTLLPGSRDTDGFYVALLRRLTP